MEKKRIWLWDLTGHETNNRFAGEGHMQIPALFYRSCDLHLHEDTNITAS
jgi:hypothetical protein